MSKDEEEEIIPELELAKAKGKRGFQKGNKLASRAVLNKVRQNKGELTEVLDNPVSTVLDILKTKGLSAAYEMVKAARGIKDKNQKFKAWMEIQKFIEGQRKQVEINVNKTEEKTITIIYKSKDTQQEIEEREPMKAVVEAEFKELQDEISEEIQNEKDS